MVVEHPPTDPPARLHQQHRPAAAGHVARGHEPGDPAADDHDVGPGRQRSLEADGLGGPGEKTATEADPGGTSQQGAAGELQVGHADSRVDDSER